ncbi:hypothetical protein JCM11251_001548 [Rhodosporidiobolus azoricus]
MAAGLGAAATARNTPTSHAGLLNSTPPSAASRFFNLESAPPRPSGIANMPGSFRAFTLVLAVLGGAAALPSPRPDPLPAPLDSALKTNLFGFVERKAIPLPPPDSSLDTRSSHPAGVAWEPLNLAGGAFIPSSPLTPVGRKSRNRSARLVSTERELRWTPAPEEGESAREPGEELAEGDEEEQELVEDDEDDGEGGDEGDMLGDEGWFKGRARARRVKRSTVGKVVRTRRSWSWKSRC